LDINENVYEFNGIIASHRLLNYKGEKNIRLFLGVGPKKYIQVNISKLKYFNNKFIGVKGKGTVLNDLDRESHIIQATEFSFY